MIGHQGIDWSRVPGSASIAGAPIPVAADGVVVDRGFQLAADGTGWGNYVVVEHTRVDGTTFQTLYAHLQSPASLQPGARVAAGQSIGGVGATGGASGPHIHMEVIVNGNARPATMGGTRGLRLNPATFTEWGELPHMIGTDANGNQIIAQDSGDRIAGTWTSTLTYRSPSGAHVRTVSLSTSPIDDGAGNTIGFSHSYSDSSGNPQTIVSNASGVVISRTTFGSAATTVEQNGLTITTDPITGARTVRIEGVSGDLPLDPSGRFSVPTANGAIEIQLNDDPFAGGDVLAGGRRYQLQGGEGLTFGDDALQIEGRPESDRGTQRVIAANGFGFEVDFERKMPDAAWILADAGISETTSDAGPDYGAGNEWLFSRARALPDAEGSTSTGTVEGASYSFAQSGDEYRLEVLVRDIDGFPTGATLVFERTSNSSDHGFDLVQREVNSSGLTTAEYFGSQAGVMSDVVWTIQTIYSFDEAGAATGYDRTTFASAGATRVERFDSAGQLSAAVETLTLPNGGRETTVFDSSGAVSSSSQTTTFDDGSSITATRLPNDMVRTTTRDTDNSITRIVEDQQVGTTRQSTVMDAAGKAIEKEQDLKAQDANVSSLQASIAQNERKIVGLRSSYRSQLENERAETLAVLNRSGQELEKSNVKAGMLEIRAPNAGVVKDMAVTTTGAVVAAGALLMNVVPANEPMQAEVLLKNEDVGFITAGQKAQVKVAAYPFQKYGLMQGEVALVSADATDPKQAPQGQPPLTYRALVKLDTLQLTSAATGEKLALNPGMLITAEIHQGQRTVLEYLISPMRKVTQEAARER
jgi:hypothetical protein